MNVRSAPTPRSPFGSRRLSRVAGALALVLSLVYCADGPTGLRRDLPAVTATDTLTFTFSRAAEVDIVPIANTGQRVLVRIESDNPADSLWARLYNGTVVVDSAIVQGATTYPIAQGPWVPRALSATELLLRLDWIRRAGRPEVSTLLRAPDQEVEHASPILAVGDTAVEQIDGLGDVDLFHLVTSDRRRITLWALVDSASSPFRLGLIPETIGSDERDRLTDNVTVSTTPIATILFPPEVGNSYAILRRDPSSAPATEPFSAGYRVWMRVIDPLPESAPALLIGEDTVTERIDEYADVDSFRLSLPANGEFRILLAQDSSSSTPVHATVRSYPYGPFTFALTPADSVLDLRRTPWIVPTLEHPFVLVAGDTGALAPRSPVGYRVLLQVRARAPETAPAALSARDSVVTETLASCADADDFTVTGTPGSRIALGAVVHERPDCRVRLRVLPSATSSPLADIAEINEVDEGLDPDSSRLPSIVVPASGQFVVRIEDIDSIGQPLGRQEHIAYTLDTYRIDTAPEIAPVEVAAGDSVTTETIDRCSDVDTFEVTGTPGTWVMMSATPSGPTDCGVGIIVDNSGAGSRHFGDDPDSQRFGPIQVPASGRLSVRVYSDRLGKRGDRGAAYVFKTDIVNPEPELNPAALTLGDTIHESFARCGDIDEFTVSLTEGQAFWLRFARERNASCSINVTARSGIFNGTSLEILAVDAMQPEYRFFNAITTGVYTVRVSSTASGSVADRELPYELELRTHVNEAAESLLAVGDTSALEPYHDRYDLDLFRVPLEAGKEYIASTIGGNVMFTSGTLVSFDPHPQGYSMRFTATTTGIREFRVGLVDSQPFPPAYRFVVHEVVPEPADDAAGIASSPRFLRRE